MKLGIESLLDNDELIDRLAGKKVALLAAPASVDHRLRHSAELLFSHPKIELETAFGAQHGLRGEKQDNMEETADYVDPVFGIPVFSLYGEVRRPTEKMMDSFDVVLVDLTDIGTRIYTFVTTLGYMLEACSEHKKEIWVLDRPNPAGRPVEGLKLVEGAESFVGLAPLQMRHGMTLGEIAKWYVDYKKLDVECNVVAMEGYDMNSGPGYGWPVTELSWVNLSPNVPTLDCARVFPGSVFLEGTTLSEGRGTTRPLEWVGAPDIDMRRVLKTMVEDREEWLKGCIVRECFFQPTFHKHEGKMCHAMQLHVDTEAYDHENFKPIRFFSLFFKTVRKLHPDYEIWRDFPYEYGGDRWAIDMLNGGPALREWVDDSDATFNDYEKMLAKDESEWLEERKPYLIY